ncbi:hypothetical protein DCAR_0935391 [Daucus carota subsp. sativus]|uniref:Uncharacterized protein n=1 Tax=Daucus carota subsp. sativus TaxID=79200 RepID=A0A175YH77_DAUCS|nr:hypothetical protein DCAR_0935391 [Daucus carota subsp. sativus]
MHIYFSQNTSNRTYKYEKDFIRDEDVDAILPGKMGSSGHDLVATEYCAHPRHNKVMKPHQVAGFNFLARNPVNDNPGGCILAHAPGSGKTSMMISLPEFHGKRSFSKTTCSAA